MSGIYLSKIARELNIGLSHIVEILASMGAEVRLDPNAKISKELYMNLLQEVEKQIKKNEPISFAKKKVDNIPIHEIINNNENQNLEFKSTLRVNLFTKKVDSVIEHAVLKTICGFLNSDGGILIIGVNDDKEPIGIEKDQFKNEDKMDLHLGNLIKSRIGKEFIINLNFRFENFKDKRIYVIEVKPSRNPVFLKTKKDEEFFIRFSGSTELLSPKEMLSYTKKRFNFLSS